MRHPSIHFPCVVPSSSTTPTGIALTIVGGIDENYFSMSVVLSSTAYTKRHKSTSRSDCHNNIRPQVTNESVVDPSKSKIALTCVLGTRLTEKPFADIDSVWGKGIINSDQRVQIVYLTL
jgi:hypothetical protein